MRSGYWQDLRLPTSAASIPSAPWRCCPWPPWSSTGRTCRSRRIRSSTKGSFEPRSSAVPADITLLVLPAQNVGLSPEHTSFAGTLSIRDSLLLDVWTDLGRSVARAGLRKLIVFNTHGGQKSLIDLLAVRLRSELGMLVGARDLFRVRRAARPVRSAELVHDIHGGEVETSLLLHLRPDLVRTSALADFKGLPHELAARNRLLGAEKARRHRLARRGPATRPARAAIAARADGRRGAQHLVVPGRAARRARRRGRGDAADAFCVSGGVVRRWPQGPRASVDEQLAALDALPADRARQGRRARSTRSPSALSRRRESRAGRRGRSLLYELVPRLARRVSAFSREAAEGRSQLLREEGAGARARRARLQRRRVLSRGVELPAARARLGRHGRHGGRRARELRDGSRRIGLLARARRARRRC